MDKHDKPDYSIYVNGQNPVLGAEEIETIHAFFRIFENDNKRASLDAMAESIANMEEFNTEIIRRVIVWMSKHHKSTCELNRHRFPELYETNHTAADATRQ